MQTDKLKTEVRELKEEIEKMKNDMSEKIDKEVGEIKDDMRMMKLWMVRMTNTLKKL